MDNFDFVAHLAQTNLALDVSAELVENFLRAYFQETYEVARKWSELESQDGQCLDQAFSELNATHQKYWLSDTRFTEYWQPCLGPPEDYLIAESGITVFADLLGNFAAILGTRKGTQVYLLSVVRNELRIVNRFFGPRSVKPCPT